MRLLLELAFVPLVADRYKETEAMILVWCAGKDTRALIGIYFRLILGLHQISSCQVKSEFGLQLRLRQLTHGVIVE